MVLAALLVLCCDRTAVLTIGTRAPATTTEILTLAPGHRDAETNKPDAPTPKPTVDSETKRDLDLDAAEENAIEPAFHQPLKPAVRESYETPLENKAWYGLVVLGHGAAGFDAWTTRRVLRGGFGVEADPLERPFANSAAIYATTQVAPLLMDFLGRRMARSGHPWMRKAWWVPQVTSAGTSLSAAVHNYRIVP
jgi:hypothetical protein